MTSSFAFQTSLGVQASFRTTPCISQLSFLHRFRSARERRCQLEAPHASLLREPDSPIPLATPQWVTRTCIAAVGSTLALLLANAPFQLPSPLPPFVVSPHLLARPATAEAQSSPTLPSTLATDDKKALRERSRRNTRASGKVSQQFSLARRQAAAGDLDGALRTYNEIIMAAPDFAPAYSNRANIYSARRKLDAALADYDRSLELAPLDGDSWVVYVNRGCTRLARGDDAYTALADMNVAFDLRGQSDIVLSNRAGVYEMLGKYDNAIRDYQMALQSNDVQPFWVRYGLVLFQRNKSYEALSILRRVASRFDVGDVHAALAIIYFDRGEVANAETEWSQVDRPKLFESRKFLEAERKWPPRAVEAMEKFRRLKE